MTMLAFVALFVGATVGTLAAAAMSSTTIRRAEDRARRLERALDECCPADLR